jgi:hypothetical protein
MYRRINAGLPNAFGEYDGTTREQIQKLSSKNILNDSESIS